MSLRCLRHEKLLYLFDSIVGLVECEGEFDISPTCTLLSGGLHASELAIRGVVEPRSVLVATLRPPRYGLHPRVIELGKHPEGLWAHLPLAPAHVLQLELVHRDWAVDGWVVGGTLLHHVS